MSPANAWTAAARRLRTTPIPGAKRPALRVIPGGATSAPRAPFVALVLVILGLGLVGLLLLNSALQQGSFELRDLEREARQLRAAEAELVHEVAKQSAPDVLAKRAGALGMAPADERAFLDVGGGTGDE